jgi:TolB-like protein/Tfp pilus assembly protein PilF
MASIIPGYEYDIFISYRQKDNKGDRWVSEFVDALKTELESTFKEEISVYFDINPHDGLLETHDVNASLKEKIKCLVFIPIISRTYCDPKSFAWEHEFKAFVEQASQDQFGLKIRLPNGNVANRVLPVHIHDLDITDIKLCESVLGGVLRGVEFIYKEPGVNRPLTIDDDEKKNINNTKYRNQINKVALAIKEIITAVGQYKQYYEEVPKETIKYKPESLKNHKTKIIAGSIILLLLILLGYFFIPKLAKSSKPVDKSIAVLPFENLTNDPEQEYFGDGMMQEILNHLFKIGGLIVPSGTSSMRFKGSKHSIREIAKDLGVSYILEGNISKSGDNIRVIVRLINGKNEQILWNDDYKCDKTAVNMLEIQSDVAQQVANKMKVVIDPEVKQRIEAKPTVNTEAYTLFLQAISKPYLSDQVRPMLERAINLDPGFADAYSALAGYWLSMGGHAGDMSRMEVITKVEPLIEKSLQLDKNSLFSHGSLALLRLYYYWDFESVEKEFQICKKLYPSNYFLNSLFSDYLLASGKYNEAFDLAKNAFNQDNNSTDNWIQMALCYYFDGQQDKALEIIDKAGNIFESNESLFTNSIRLQVYCSKYDNAIRSFEKNMADKQPKDLISYYLGHLGIAYLKTGKTDRSMAFLNELLARSRRSPIGSPSFFAAAVYTAMGENDKALQLLEKAYTDHEVEMYWLKVEPLFRPLHGDPRFENLLIKIGIK